MEEQVIEKKKEKNMNKVRTYYGKVAIVGQSGTGKTFISKTADRNTTGFINAERKPLSYKAEPFKFEVQPQSWNDYIKAFKEFSENSEIKLIFVDSQSEIFEMLENEMSRQFTGFDIYKNVNKQIYGYLQLLKNAQKDVIILSHYEALREEGGDKVKKMVAPGKKWEGSIEKAFTIVLYTGTRVKDGRPSYFLKTFEQDTSTKVPEGLFLDDKKQALLEIPNSAEFIFNALENYYSN